VQQIEIQTVRSKTPQAVLARRDRPRLCRIFGKDLADKEQLVAASAIASPTSTSAPPSAYISAVSISVMQETERIDDLGCSSPAVT
jgi:hypothetical protein